MYYQYAGLLNSISQDMDIFLIWPGLMISFSLGFLLIPSPIPHISAYPHVSGSTLYALIRIMPLLENSLHYSLENIRKDLSNGVIEVAKLKLIPLVNDYHTVLEVQLLLLELALAEGNFVKGLQVLTHLRAKHKFEEKYKELVCRIVHSALLESTEDHAGTTTSHCLKPIAADLVIKAEKQSKPSVPVNTYRRFFLCGILPQIFLDKVRCKGPETNDPDDKKNCQNMVSYENLLEWMKLHQAYYIAQIDWRSMYQSMVHVLKQCGFLPQKCEISSIVPDANSNIMFPDVLLESLRLQKIDLPVDLKSLFLTTCFTQICFEYQSLVFNPTKSNECSIPVGDYNGAKKTKKSKTGKLSKSKQKSKDVSSARPVTDAATPTSTSGENSKVSAQTTITLRKAQEILILIESTDGGQVLEQMINDWSLPFHITNAILLCNADIRLMEKRYSDSYELYLELSKRCQTRWRLKNDIADGTSVSFHPLYQFRLLYSLSLASDHMGQSKNARKYLFPILYSGIPCGFNDLSFDFEQSSKFRLRPVSTAALLSRCIQNLIVSYVNDIEQCGFDHDLIGDLLVLSQFAPAQLPDQLQWISTLLIRSGRFVYREFFHFVFSEAILQQIFQVRNLNDLYISLLPVKNETSSPERSEVSQVE
ncbi:hypothetical protein K493DRAFT_340225, partial [Basidiobolus meristosporus CBS 931.73]